MHRHVNLQVQLCCYLKRILNFQPQMHLLVHLYIDLNCTDKYIFKCTIKCKVKFILFITSLRMFNGSLKWTRRSNFKCNIKTTNECFCKLFRINECTNKCKYRCSSIGTSSALLSASSNATLREVSNEPSFVSLCKLLSASIGAALMYP